jgi:hypothetical protein
MTMGKVGAAWAALLRRRSTCAASRWWSDEEDFAEHTAAHHSSGVFVLLATSGATTRTASRADAIQGQKLLVALAGVASHDAAHRGIRFERDREFMERDDLNR